MTTAPPPRNVRYWKTLSGPHASLENAEASFDAGRYEEARDLADWAAAMTKQVVDRVGQALEDFEVAEAARDRLTAEGIPSGAMESTLLDARERIEAGDLEGAAAAAKEARDNAERIRETGARIVASGNPGCLMQIARHCRALGVDVEVAHPVSLLARALEVS